jgi:PAS domain-containing protein
MLGASTPLYAAGAAILLSMMVSSPLVFPPPTGWFRSGGAFIMLLILALVWRRSQEHSLTARQSGFLQMLLVLAATGMCVITQLWNPSSEVTYGFVIAPLVLSVVYRSVGISIGANVIIAIAWAVTWRLNDFPVSSHTFLIHLLYVPILSIALSITQQDALRKLAAFHEDQAKRIQERHKAMREIAEQASLRAKSEAELRRKNALLESILATVPDGIFVKDRQGRILMASHGYCLHDGSKTLAFRRIL